MQNVFADTYERSGHGEQPQWLYTVVFRASESCSPMATKHPTVAIDAWEPYLESL